MFRFLLPVVLAFAGGALERTPDQIKYATPRDHFPLWVSLSHAFRNNNEVDAGLFAPYALRRVQTHLFRQSSDQPTSSSIAADPCEGRATDVDSDRVDPKPNKSLASISAYAIAVYRGTIEDITPGFLGGQPGSLLGVRVTRGLKTSPALRGDSRVLVYYPYLRATVGAYRVCKTDSRFGYRPEVGDEVLVFAYQIPFDELQRVIVPEATEIAFQSKTGALHLGRDLDESDLARIKTLGDFEVEVERLIGRGEDLGPRRRQE